uniref:Capsid protein n=1 Tax=Dromedary picobirnavirus TaxID=1574421 RepID=A0A0A1ELB3_9VIRU|nr:capsid protein [Dromedary picobirnavirus]
MAEKKFSKSQKSNATFNKPKSTKRRGNKKEQRSQSARYSKDLENKVKNAFQNNGSSEFTEVDQPKNHITWYNRIPSVFESAFSVATVPSLGWPIRYDKHSTTVGYSVDQLAIPGVMSIEFIPTIGKAQTRLDPVNKVSEAIWKRFRTGITSNGWYEPADLMMYFMAADSIYMTLNVLKRLYGVATWYSARNRYLPDALIEAMGFRPDDEYLRQSLPLLRMGINKLAAKMATYHVPGDITLMTRHSWLCANIFCDEDPAVTDMTQLYVFVPTYVYKARLSASGAGSLHPISFMGDAVVDVLNEVSDMIDEMAVLFDAIKFSAEVDRVYGNRICTFSPVELDYQVGPAYDRNMLLQIHNMVIINDVQPNDIEQYSTSTETTPGASYLKQDMSYDLGSMPWIPMYSGAVGLDFYSPTVTSDDVCYATRLSAASTRDSDDGDFYCIYGSELVCNAYTYRFNGHNVVRDPYYSHMSIDDSVPESTLRMLGAALVFDNAPTIQMLSKVGTWTEEYPTGGVGYVCE